MKPLKKVCIVGGHEAKTIKIYDAESGRKLEQVTRAVISIDSGGRAMCQVTQEFEVEHIAIAAVVEGDITTPPPPAAATPDPVPAAPVATGLRECKPLDEPEDDGAPFVRTILAPGAPWPFPPKIDASYTPPAIGAPRPVGA